DRLSLIFEDEKLPPAALLSFTAEKELSSVKLKWMTASSTQDGFIIERSNDGVIFSEIAAISGSNTSTKSYIDLKPVLGKNFYRIIQVDDLNHKTYSGVLAVDFQNDLPLNDYLETRKVGRNKIRYIFLAMIILVFIFTMTRLNSDLTAQISLCVIYAVIFSLIYFLSNVFGKYLIKKQYKTTELLRLETEWQIDETGLKIRCVTSNFNISWKQIYKLKETKTHLMLFIGSMSTYVVPKSLLKQGDLEKIYEWKAAQSQK
ncbi:MAG: YcxB family protein, partial [Sphingobacteriales bacterium]